MSPLRRLAENPRAILAPHVKEGMLVLEPGPGMGFFTLELARLVGAHGRVVAVDLQERMLRALQQRATKAGLLDRLELRLAGASDLGVADLAGKVDFALLFHMLHEVPDQGVFLAAVSATLRPGADVLLVEPPLHVSKRDFAASLDVCRAQGLEVVAEPSRHRALLRKREA